MKKYKHPWKLNEVTTPDGMDLLEIVDKKGNSVCFREHLCADDKEVMEKIVEQMNMLHDDQKESYQ